jgi:hypothetical protein
MNMVGQVAACQKIRYETLGWGTGGAHYAQKPVTPLNTAMCEVLYFGLAHALDGLNRKNLGAGPRPDVPLTGTW